MMTKKDYEAVAAALRREIELASDDRLPLTGPAVRMAVRSVTLRLASEFARGNPRFDSRRFVQAVGVEV